MTIVQTTDTTETTRRAAYEPPAWAEAAVFNHQDDIATFYSSERDDRLVYLQRSDAIEPDGQRPLNPTQLIITVGDDSIHTNADLKIMRTLIEQLSDVAVAYAKETEK